VVVTLAPVVSAVGHQGVDPLALHTEALQFPPHLPPPLDVELAEPADDIVRGDLGTPFPGLV
jgi:hypothetical protein